MHFKMEDLDLPSHCHRPCPSRLWTRYLVGERILLEDGTSLTHAEAAKQIRLAWAITCDASQSKTISGRIRVKFSGNYADQMLQFVPNIRKIPPVETKTECPSLRFTSAKFLYTARISITSYVTHSDMIIFPCTLTTSAISLLTT